MKFAANYILSVQKGSLPWGLFSFHLDVLLLLKLFSVGFSQIHFRSGLLTSLYPLGMVPEISSVDVKQPAGQYLLRGDRKHTMNVWRLDCCANIQRKRYLPELCLREISSFVQASDKICKSKQTVSELVSLRCFGFYFCFTEGSNCLLFVCSVFISHFNYFKQQTVVVKCDPQQTLFNLFYSSL